MKDDKVIEKLVSALAVNHVLILAHGVLIQRLGISKQVYADAVKTCIRHFGPYKSKIIANVRSQRTRPQTEKELWESLGLGDLWGPSIGREPDESGPKTS